MHVKRTTVIVLMGLSLGSWTVIARGRDTNAAAPPAPEFTGVTEWINSKPLKLADQKGKEVRVEKSKIDERRVSQQSPMPANLADEIMEPDFYHLMAFLLTQIQHSLNMTLPQTGLIVAMTLTASVVGGVAIGWLGDKIGRKKALLASLALLAAGSILSALAGHYGNHHATGRTRGSELWIGDVPLFVPLSYTFMGYFAFAAGRLVASGPASGRRSR